MAGSYTGGTVTKIKHDSGGSYAVTVSFTDPVEIKTFTFPTPGPAEFLDDFKDAKAGGETVDVETETDPPNAILRVTRK